MFFHGATDVDDIVGDDAEADPAVHSEVACAGEVVRLKVKHIDSAQKIIRIEQSKGRKDRNVMLSAETLDLLRQWWKARPPGYDATTPLQECWLFPGRKPGR